MRLLDLAVRVHAPEPVVSRVEMTAVLRVVAHVTSGDDVAFAFPRAEVDPKVPVGVYLDLQLALPGPCLGGIEAWGGKGPFGDVLCFVVTHRPPASADPVFTFVTDGIEGALAKARAVAGDKGIGLMGANVNQQFLAAGLVDEIRIHLVNVLLGGGRRLFDRLPQRIELEQTGLTETDGVTHLAYRVIR